MILFNEKNERMLRKMISAFLKGFGVGGGLIVAIGAQNAFVLSQGARKNYYLAIPLICSVCDAVLITVGIMGVGRAVAANALLTRAASAGGAAFLFWYGLRSFRSAIEGGSLDSDGKAAGSFKAVVLTTLAVTLLNPHVYLDTIILMGSISSRFSEPIRIFFGAGAVTASVVWFFSLSIGGRMLAPVFKQPVSWKILDSVVGIVMWSIAASLVINMP